MYLLTKLTKYKLVIAVAMTMIFGLVLAPVAFAACTTDADCNADNNETCGMAGTCIQDTFGVDTMDNSLQLGNKDLIETAVDLINVALGLLGIIAVVIILIGGFKWMTAGGNEENVAEARKWIFSGIIGLAIILSAWAISRFVITQLADATESGDVPAAPIN